MSMGKVAQPVDPAQRRSCAGIDDGDPSARPLDHHPEIACTARCRRARRKQQRRASCQKRRKLTHRFPPRPSVPRRSQGKHDIDQGFNCEARRDLPGATLPRRRSRVGVFTDQYGGLRPGKRCKKEGRDRPWDSLQRLRKPPAAMRRSPAIPPLAAPGRTIGPCNAHRIFPAAARIALDCPAGRTHNENCSYSSESKANPGGKSSTCTFVSAVR